MAVFNERQHLAVEKGEQQGADMGAVHVGIGHDDDLVIAQFFQIKFLPADTCAQRGDELFDLLRA